MSFQSLQSEWVPRVNESICRVNEFLEFAECCGQFWELPERYSESLELTEYCGQFWELTRRYSESLELTECCGQFWELPEHFSESFKYAQVLCDTASQSERVSRVCRVLWSVLGACRALK